MTNSGERGTKAFIRFEVVKMVPAVSAPWGPFLLWEARAICLRTQLTSHLLKVGALNAKWNVSFPCFLFPPVGGEWNTVKSPSQSFRKASTQAKKSWEVYLQLLPAMTGTETSLWSPGLRKLKCRKTDGPLPLGRLRGHQLSKFSGLQMDMETPPMHTSLNPSM